LAADLYLAAGRVRRSRPYRRVSGDPQAARWPPPPARGGHRFLAFVVRHAFMVDTPLARKKAISRTPDSYGLNAHEAHALRGAAPTGEDDACHAAELKLIMKTGRLPDAMKPGIHCVRAQWIRGFMTLHRVRHARTVMLMVSA
jgi:hypothetical protein